jgi:hypothetical protein
LSAKSHQDSSLIRIRVHPGASRNEITGMTDDVLQVRIAAPPVKGKANYELIDFLSHTLGVSKSLISIVKGQTSRNKIIAIAGLSHDDITTRLSA